MIAFAALLLTGAGASLVSQDGWGSFSARGVRSRIEISVIIGTENTRENQVDYWFLQTISNPGQSRRTSRVSTRQCPAMLFLLEELRNLPSPRIQPPFLEDSDVTVTADGIGYTLTMPAAYSTAAAGEITLRSNVGTPLAAWIDRAVGQLAACQNQHAEPL